ncbi:MAG: hypothetical protein ISR96_06970 [Nitrospira sp.]|nr:hypothetical protein [bacterium]MBL7049236.1 hypothetical protein [Nitrospira sp.]
MLDKSVNRETGSGKVLQSESFKKPFKGPDRRKFGRKAPVGHPWRQYRVQNGDAGT